MSRPRAGTLAILVAVSALVLLLAYGVVRQHGNKSLDRAIKDGKRPTAPTLELPRLGTGGNAALADWHGKVVVVNFWASWCVPCREETPLLQRWQREISRRGGTVVGVNVLDVDSDALQFARSFHLTYPMLRDKDGAGSRRFGVTGYPETIVLDRRGRVAAIGRGPVDDRFLRTHIHPLLGERT